MLPAAILESCWLLTTALIPLIYDPHAALGFDPPKMAFFRAIGVVAAAGLLLSIRMPPRLGALRPANTWPAVATLALATIIANFFAFDPQCSFWGSPQFLQGTATGLAGIALFAAVATHLRSPAQLDRLISVTLAASVPVCLYALYQKYGLDGGRFTGGTPIALSLAGHPLYLAGYLAMVIPLTAWKIWQSTSRVASPPQPFNPSSRQPLNPTIVAPALLLLLQFSAFIATEKRGPILALLFAGFATLILLAIRQRKPRLAHAAIAVVVSAGLLLGALAALGRATTSLDQVPLLSRLSRIVPLPDRPADPFRDSLWAEASAIVTGSRPVQLADKTSDPLAPARGLVGYGPESLQLILPQYWTYVNSGPMPLQESRFHNGFWDVLQSVGLLGLAATFWFFASLYFAGCRALGLASRFTVAIPLGSAAFGGVAFASLYGLGYLGLGIPIGFASGLLLSTVLGKPNVPTASPSHASFVALPFLAALLAHWIESTFSFPTAASFACFWIFAGTVTALALPSQKLDPAESAERTNPNIPAAGILAGLMLTILINGFIDDPANAANSPWAAARNALLGAPEGPPKFLLLLVVLPSLGGILALVGSAFALRHRRDWLRAAALALAFPVLWTAIKCLWIPFIGTFPGPDAPASAVLARSFRWELISPALLLIALASLVALARVLPPTSARSLRRFRLIPTLVLLPITGLAIWFLAIKPLQIEAASRQADLLLRTNRPAPAAASFERILALDPSNRANRNQLAAAIQALALQQTDPAAFAKLMDQAVAVLAAPSPHLHASHYPLARLLTTYALRTPDPERRSILARQAATTFDQAIAFQPDAAITRFDAALVANLLLNAPTTGRELLAQANAITSPDNPLPINAAPWGDYYHQLALDAAHPALRRAYANRAIEFFNRSIADEFTILALPSTSPGYARNLKANIYTSLTTKAKLEAATGAAKAALASTELAIRLRPEPAPWDAHAIAAQAAHTLSLPAKTTEHLQAAIATAPPAEIPALKSLQSSLKPPN